MACSSGCPTPGAHGTFGECLRAKNMEVQAVEAHRFLSAQRKAQNDYATARQAGLQPDGIFPNQVRQAWRISDATGTAYRADK